MDMFSMEKPVLFYFISIIILIATRHSTFSVPDCNPPLVQDSALPTTFFAPAQAELSSLSDHLATLPLTGTTNYPSSGYTLTIPDTSLGVHVFSLTGSKISTWGNAWKVDTFINDICNNVIPGSTVILNIDGASVSLLGGGIYDSKIDTYQDRLHLLREV
jgi:choice-of-anchor A domain-containing protein